MRFPAQLTPPSGPFLVALHDLSATPPIPRRATHVPLRPLTPFPAAPRHLQQVIGDSTSPNPTTPPPSDVITTAIRILDLETVNDQPGEPADIAITRILDLIESRLEGDEDEVPPGADDRYCVRTAETACRSRERYAQAMFALVVRFDLRDAKAANDFDQLVADTVGAISENEPGTLVYSTHEVEGEPLARIFYEVYADRAAFEEHERQPHVRHFLAAREDYTRAVRVEFLTPGAATGLPGTS
ncbi:MULTISPECIES: putative quinol monooxygenase [unclassified Nocardia]|uniref:putative quinol monooxygenase n=1 Tax=unclassified Nocardia TaxID=2637762 RepID=UPI00278BB7BA|nr:MULTISPECIES: antibiotic biosynthesis monooxygenase [unclassified Nocardia]